MSSAYEEILAKLKEKSDEFSTFLTDINNLNNDIKSRTEKLLQAIEKLKGKEPVKLCTVCYTRDRSHANLNCGHTFCENCGQRGLNRSKCFTCRAPVEGLFRIFL